VAAATAAAVDVGDQVGINRGVDGGVTGDTPAATLTDGFDALRTSSSHIVGAAAATGGGAAATNLVLWVYSPSVYLLQVGLALHRLVAMKLL
jgi:hypothetical protein